MKIGKVFKKYRVGCEYDIPLKDIVITDEFLSTSIGKLKLRRKYEFYQRNGYFQSKILINNNWELVDGYTTWWIAKDLGIKKVTVKFID